VCTFNDDFTQVFFSSSYRPLRPSCWTINPPCLSVSCFLFPIWATVQRLHVSIHYIFPSWTGSSKKFLPSFGFSANTMCSGGLWLRHAWSAHCSLLLWIIINMFGFWKSSSSTLFFLILYPSNFSYLTGPKIFLRIFLSSTKIYWTD
jgi:hypothetical protein